MAINVDAIRGTAVKAAVNKIIAEQGRIDILINNIGGNEML